MTPTTTRMMPIVHRIEIPVKKPTINKTIPRMMMASSLIRSPLRSTYPLVTALKQGGWTARRYGHSSLDCFHVMAQGVLVCRLIVVGRQWFATSHNPNSKIKTSTKTTKKVIRAKGGRRVGASAGKSSPYEAWTVEELTDRAKELDLQGDSKLEKSELIDALRNH